MKNRFVLAVILGQLLLTIAFPLPVHAQTAWTGACVYTNIPQKNGENDGVATITGVECLVKNVLSIGVSAVGISSFVMLIIGSIMHLTSGGEPRKAETANKTMTYAVAAILLSVTGWIVINFISVFTGVTSIQTFHLGLPGQ
ncbi:MAG TPA: hypothetical protein VFG51_03370 [Candidatus Saccharimonadia bacterium]|nr:hypothetical protein [Candidatus Saccharimonadia bacterium]